MEKKSDDDQGLPDMVKGDTAKVVLSKAESKKDKPPARFTDGSLVSAMASIHKFITEEGGEGSSRSIRNAFVKAMVSARKQLAQILLKPFCSGSL